jgi:hypothetical protein
MGLYKDTGHPKIDMLMGHDIEYGILVCSDESRRTSCWGCSWGYYGYISQHGDKPNKLNFSLGSHLDYTVAIYQLLGTAKIALYLGVGSEL